MQLPLAELDVAYLLAWLASTSAHPEVRITVKDTKQEVTKAEHWAPAAREGDWWIYRVGISGVPIVNKHAMQRLAKALGGDSAITALELSTAIPDEFVDDERGTSETTARVRLRGTVKGGVWFIDAAEPTVEATVLEDALSLCRQVLAGKMLTLRDDEEAAAFDAVAKSWSYLIINGAITKKGLERILPDSDSDALGMYASRVFRLRFGEIWECALPIDDEDDEED